MCIRITKLKYELYLLIIIVVILVILIFNISPTPSYSAFQLSGYCCSLLADLPLKDVILCKYVQLWEYADYFLGYKGYITYLE